MTGLDVLLILLLVYMGWRAVWRVIAHRDRHENPPPEGPQTLEEVAQCVWEAVVRLGFRPEKLKFRVDVDGYGGQNCSFTVVVPPEDPEQLHEEEDH